MADKVRGVSVYNEETQQPGDITQTSPLPLIKLVLNHCCCSFRLLPQYSMSDAKEKPSSLHDAEKDQVLHELGDVAVTGEVLTAEEDRRILRKIDLKCVWSFLN